MQLGKKAVIGRRRLQQRVQELGRLITQEYRDRQLVLLGVLNGAFIFAADLCRAIDLKLEIDFIRVTSYGASTESSGTIRLLKEPSIDLNGKDVLLVEDIVDTGTTMAWLRDHFRQSPAKSVKICSLIDKQERRIVPVEVDYVGFALDRGFLVGYGLDCAEQYRNLPAIYSLR
ncbi:hypoxanthine phosphoribosyltransferase [Desulfobulbus propionicus DSM 2032]|jgi:hypoxanthine phosphoribosyltransferase|uniref:Hypoxanthine phosphoribosyltransferase n=1 Tax=Desulfobulbus propionicus (strain ATCC 33891 / DSM 2032 / VKM B-1956 / 1pr3) TaxID=577650 RepID=A0A7U3YJF2_DESPD|nr:hypoxanthine phosphoribosyltransferase [Desulfobulbus propionicus]ADW16506.1 hypoxanthine phosphoribosyltransferase [Desulfobulbus propionicus DSM 2032]